MTALERFLLTTLGITIETGLRYAFFAGIAWLLCYVLFKRRWWHRKVVQREPLAADVRREMRYSLMTLVVFGAVGALTVAAVKAGWTQMYWRIGSFGWGWFVASVAVAIFVHDAWFYWTHRLMHHRRLFRWFHRGHHLSTNPSPWAAYAFDPLEAVVQALIFPIAITIMPMHPLAFLAFMTWQIIFNVAGHTGYELWPRWMMDSWLGKFMNTPTNHAMHHEFIRGNYGLYFNFWDRLMGTNQAGYEDRFREVTSRERAEATVRGSR
ncbi:MAG: sterol desaturase family protein [Chthoniobacteraceae bacterium]